MQRQQSKVGGLDTRLARRQPDADERELLQLLSRLLFGCESGSAEQSCVQWRQRLQLEFKQWEEGEQGGRRLMPRDAEMRPLRYKLLQGGE